MKVKKQQLEAYVKQLTDSKLGKEYDKAVYCHSVYLTYRLSISCTTHAGPPKMDGSRWRVLTKRVPLEKGMANHFSIFALRIP